MNLVVNKFNDLYVIQPTMNDVLLTEYMFGPATRVDDAVFFDAVPKVTSYYE